MNAVALTTPVDVGLVASAITNDAVAASPAFLVIHIDVVEGGALHTVFIEQASIALVAEERARELADEVDMALHGDRMSASRATSQAEPPSSKVSDGEACGQGGLSSSVLPGIAALKFLSPAVLRSRTALLVLA